MQAAERTKTGREGTPSRCRSPVLLRSVTTTRNVSSSAEPRETHSKKRARKHGTRSNRSQRRIWRGLCTTHARVSACTGQPCSESGSKPTGKRTHTNHTRADRVAVRRTEAVPGFAHGFASREVDQAHERHARGRVGRLARRAAKRTEARRVRGTPCGLADVRAKHEQRGGSKGRTAVHAKQPGKQQLRSAVGRHDEAQIVTLTWTAPSF